jgi:hypothetical protein
MYLEKEGQLLLTWGRGRSVRVSTGGLGGSQRPGGSQDGRSEGGEGEEGFGQHFDRC